MALHLPSITELRNTRVELERFKARVLILQIVVLVCFVLLLSRLVYLQIVEHEDLLEQAENNRTAVLPTVPPRGAILDRNGVVLASNYSAYTLEITPAKLIEGAGEYVARMWPLLTSAVFGVFFEPIKLLVPRFGGFRLDGLLTQAFKSGSNAYIADTFDQRFFTDQVLPAAGNGRWQVQFTRTNPANTDGTDVAKLENVYAVRRYPTKVLPGVTVIRVTTKATEQATSIRDRKFNLRWQRHVRTLTSTTLSASRNFARAIAHLWCVAGEDLAEIDTDALAAINAAWGETSALLRFDGSLDDADMSLGERMQLIANHARCVLWRNGTQWTVTRDQARTSPELQLDYRNLAARGDSTISYASHLPASYDGVEVEYVDETTQAKKAYVRLNISSGAVATGSASNPLKVKLPGCTTTSQADNRAQLEARRLMYSRTSVQDTALPDASQLGVGSLVRWVDPNDFAGDDGLQAGEVLAIDSLTLTTSEPLDWHGEATGRILVTGVDGLYLGSPVVCAPGAAANKVVLASVPVGTYVRNGTTQQLGSRYAFAVGMTEAEMQAAGLFTVTEVTPAADRTLSIALAAYDARMYEED